MNNGINLKLIVIIIFYIIIKYKFSTKKLKKDKKINLDLYDLKKVLIHPNSNIDENKIYDKIDVVLKYYKDMLISGKYQRLFYYKLVFIFLYILLFSIIFYNTECVITSVIIFGMMFVILPSRVILINIIDNDLKYKYLWEYSKYLEIFIILIMCLKIMKVYSNKYSSNLDFINIVKIIIYEFKKYFLKIDNNILVKEFNNVFIK